MMAEEESENYVEEVPAVEVLELEEEQQVGQGDVFDPADDFRSCTLGLQHLSMQEAVLSTTGISDSMALPGEDVGVVEEEGSICCCKSC